MISSHEFEYQALLEILQCLEIENKKIKTVQEDSTNRSVRKKVIFRNNIQDHRKESRDETKIILAKDIK